jgi:hypothetical protein
MRQGRKVGSGKTGPHIRLGRVLTERREAAPSIPDEERSQKRFAKRLGVSQSFLSQLERGEKNLANYSLAWFERYSPFYGWTRDEMLAALELEDAGNGKVRPTRATELSGVVTEERTVVFRRVPYFEDGAEPIERRTPHDTKAWLEDDGFLEAHPNGYYFKIADENMEPHFPKGWLAAVVPDPKLAQPRSPVLVWFSSGKRVVRYLVQKDADGTLTVYQPSPSGSEQRIHIAPTGSRVLGVVVDVKREIEPSRTIRVSSREIAAALAEDMPELLDTVDL